jgi:hypothetical protein
MCLETIVSRDSRPTAKLIFWHTVYEKMVSNDFDIHLMCLRIRSFVSFALVFLLLASPLQNNICTVAEFIDRRRVVVMGDLHSDYLQAVRNFVMAKLINPQTHTWNAKSTILVITGDTVDRGRDTKKLYQLLRDMAKQATKFNSEVHITLGTEKTQLISY